MKLKNIKKIAGLTLIETLVYLAIFGLLFASVMQFLFFFSQSDRRAQIRQDLENILIYTNSHINDTFIKSSSIDTTNSIFNNNNGKLRTLSSSGQYYEYSIQSGRINFNNNGTTNYLTNPEFIVDQFLVEQVLSSSNAIVGVRITMDYYNKTEQSIKKNYTTMYSLK